MWKEIEAFTNDSSLRRYDGGRARQYVVFKPLTYCGEETIGSDVKILFARPPVSRLIKPAGVTKEF